MSKVITLSNQKGGVAKTTSLYNLGAIAAQRGYKVLLIDFDSQASLVISMGYDPDGFDNTISTLIDDYITRKNSKMSIYECIYPGRIENLYFIPSMIDLATKEMQMNGITSKETILNRILKDIKEEYDYIFIDTGPSLNNLTINALSASDYVLIPSEAKKLSYKAISYLTNIISDVKELINPNLKTIGIIVTNFEENTKESKEILKDMDENYNVIGVVNKSVEITNGMKLGLPISSLPLNKLEKPGKRIVENYNKIFDLIDELK